MSQKRSISELFKRVLDHVRSEVPDDVSIQLGEMSKKDSSECHQYWTKLGRDELDKNKFTVLLHPDFDNVKWLTFIRDKTGRIYDQVEIDFNDEGNPDPRFEEEYRLILFGHLYEQTIALLQQVMTILESDISDEGIDYEARLIAKRYFETLMET